MHLNVLFIKTNCYTKYRLRVYALHSLFVTSAKNFQMMPKQNENVRDRDGVDGKAFEKRFKITTLYGIGIENLKTRCKDIRFS